MQCFLIHWRKQQITIQRFSSCYSHWTISHDLSPSVNCDWREMHIASWETRSLIGYKHNSSSLFLNCCKSSQTLFPPVGKLHFFPPTHVGWWSLGDQDEPLKVLLVQLPVSRLQCFFFPFVKFFIFFFKAEPFSDRARAKLGGGMGWGRGAKLTVVHSLIANMNLPCRFCWPTADVIEPDNTS